MNTPDMKIRQGARLVFTVTKPDDDAQNATFKMRNKDTQDVITATESFDTEGVAYFEINDTDVVGVYDYQIEVNYGSGKPDIYPNFDDCDGDCDLPTVEICESIQLGDS